MPIPGHTRCAVIEFETLPNTTEFILPSPPLSGVRQALLGQPSLPPTILLISDQDAERAEVGSILRREGWRIVETRSAAIALELLNNTRPDLVILDRDLSGMDALECCRRIKANRLTELTPVLMVTAVKSVQDEIAGIQAGADEYLSKPLHPEVFRARVRSLIRHKTAVDRLEESESILFALAQAVEKRDSCTAGHCQRLASLSVAFGVRLGLSQAQLLALHRGGYLHDIGKIAIADAILFKPGKLSPEEWTLMKTHTARGEEICYPLRSLEQVLPIIRNHHERWDGGGYPDGLRGEKIPLLARILQLTDIYDALTSERPYKPAYSSAVALDMMREEAKMGWRDWELTELFTALPFSEIGALNEFQSDDEADSFERSLQSFQHLALAS